MKFVGEVNPYQNFVLNTIKVPKKLFFAARAIFHQTFNQVESAMNDWIECGNYNIAHSLFIKSIAPHYFVEDKNQLTLLRPECKAAI